jgi:hemin uptake protein HemP
MWKYSGPSTAGSLPGAAGAIAQTADATSAGPATLDVRTLLQGSREAVLLLDGEPYRLRITAKGKLILTK